MSKIVQVNKIITRLHQFGQQLDICFLDIQSFDQFQKSFLTFRVMADNVLQMQTQRKVLLSQHKKSEATHYTDSNIKPQIKKLKACLEYLKSQVQRQKRKKNLEKSELIEQLRMCEQLYLSISQTQKTVWNRVSTKYISLQELKGKKKVRQKKQQMLQGLMDEQQEKAIREFEQIDKQIVKNVLLGIKIRYNYLGFIGVAGEGKRAASLHYLIYKEDSDGKEEGSLNNTNIKAIEALTPSWKYFTYFFLGIVGLGLIGVIVYLIISKF